MRASPAPRGPLLGDRRTRQRTPLELDITLQSDSMLAKGITIDISDGGVFVCTAYKIPVGELLQLAIALPGGGWLKARGEVRWARAASQGTLPGVGIAFAYVSPIDRAMIDRFLN